MTRAIFSFGKVRAVIRSKWRTLLKGATKETEVLVLVRTFTAAWTADEIAAIPRDLWPSRVVTPRDVTDTAARLASAHASYDGDVPSLALLQELLLFMTQAAVRIKVLGHVAASAGAPERQVATEPEERIGGEVPSATRDVPAEGSTSEVSLVAVFDYEEYDRVTRSWKIAPNAGTLEAIARVGGVPVRSSGLQVERSRLDDNGFLRKANIIA